MKLEHEETDYFLARQFFEEIGAEIFKHELALLKHFSNLPHNKIAHLQNPLLIIHYELIKIKNFLKEIDS